MNALNVDQKQASPIEVLLFRWCHTCNLSVCSTCFVDNHKNPDGNGFHAASNWDSHVGVKSGVGQLMQMSLDHKQITEKCKTDVAEYLDGLNIYLARKIDDAAKINQGATHSLAVTISQAYGISLEEAAASKPIPEDKFFYILNDAKKICQESSSTADLVEIRFQQLPYERFNSIIMGNRVAPPPPPVPSSNNWLSNLQSKIVNAELFGIEKVTNPIDLVVIGDKHIDSIATQAFPP